MPRIKNASRFASASGNLFPIINEEALHLAFISHFNIIILSIFAKYDLQMM
jgi:hypothetical protein